MVTWRQTLMVARAGTDGIRRCTEYRAFWPTPAALHGTASSSYDARVRSAPTVLSTGVQSAGRVMAGRENYHENAAIRVRGG